MDPAKRIVTRMPLANLWNNEGELQAHRIRTVGRQEIAKLLRDGSTFVVANVGCALRWIPAEDRFTFWNTEVKGHLVPPEADGFLLEDHPNEYCYVASVWHCVNSKPAVVLEMYH